MEIGWTDVGSGGYILVSCAHSNTSWYYISVYWYIITRHLYFYIIQESLNEELKFL